MSSLYKKVNVQTKRGYKLYWIGCGNTDVFKPYPKSEEFRNLLVSLGGYAIFHGTGKGHVWPNWRQYLLEFAPLLFRNE